MTIESYDSKEKVYEFLREHAVAVLATVSQDGSPSASPIYFVPDKQLNFYFMTKSDTEKSKNIESGNKRVALTVVDSVIPMVVQAKGQVSEIQDPDIFAKITDENAKEESGFHWPPPLSKLESEGALLMYVFTPTWLRVADFSESGGGSSHPGTSVFHQIIS